MDSETFNQLKQTELLILCDLHEYCVKYDIQYSLFGGTALGAVRHKGFIPWDDDIDIAMTREEYEKFCDLWKKNPLNGYFLENFFTEEHCEISHAKVKKNGTLLISEGKSEDGIHRGIWVDIFPLDKITKDNKDIVQKLARRLMICTRGNAKDYTDSFSKKCIKFILRRIPKTIKNKILKDTVRQLNEFNTVSDNFNWVDLSAGYTMNLFFPQNLVDETIDIQFEGKTFKIYKEYDAMLKSKYGDYMKLPPIEERVCLHNPIKVQF